MEESFSHIILCGVCSKPYNDPRILPCLHSFCQQCIHHEIEKSGSQQVFKCPTCERSTRIPVGGASVLPQNLHLAFEVEAAGYMSKIVSNSDVCCDPCIDGRSGPAEVFCCTCYRFMCTFCHEHHKRHPKLSKHNMVGLDQEGAKQLQTTMKPRDRYCSQSSHEDNKLNFYCETCKLLVCRDCTTVAHKDHGVSEVSTVAEAHRDDMRRTLQYVQDTLAGAIGANEKTMKQVETSKHEAQLAIDLAFEQLLERLVQRKKALLSEMESIALTQTTSLTLQKEQFEKIQQNIIHYSEVTSHILLTHTDHEVVAMGGCVPTELKATIMEVENVSLTTSQYGPITVDVQVDILMKELSMFGYVFEQSPVPCKSELTIQSVIRKNTKCSMKLETRMLNGERYPHGGVQVEAEMRSKAHNGAVMYGEVEDHRDGTYTITLTPQTAGPHQLVITMDGQHVQNSPHNVYAKHDYNLTLCKAQSVIKCSQPLCVAVHDNGDIYVGSNHHCIYVFDQTGQLKGTIGSRGNGDGQFRCPYGISIKGDMLYVADSDNHRIQKLTSGGEFIHKFGQKGSSQGKFNTPEAVIVDSDNRVIVSDLWNDRIQIFNEDGGWLLTINGFLLPVSLALDHQENIHVTEQDRIKVFNKEGVYVRTYGGPSSGRKRIAIDDEGNTLVTYGLHYSTVYNNGNRIHHMGSFEDPMCIALDARDGSVYVADYGANSVLKYTDI